MDAKGGGARGRGRGRGRGGRGSRGGRGRGRGKTTTARGRPKKMVIESEEEEEIIETSEIVDNQVDLLDDDHEDEMVIDENYKPEENEPEHPKSEVEFTIDDDISQLVPPTFSTVSKGPPQPMVDLSWDHKYTPIADKISTPNIHMCVECKLPIRIYGRLIPCKHVYCHLCATKQSNCSCCIERVSRVEQAHLGQVFMCHHGGTRYGFEGCRRTYLSQRDLQAHVDHRHKPRTSGGGGGGGDRISPTDRDRDHNSINSYGGRQNQNQNYNTGSARGGGVTSGGGRPSEQGSTPASRYERKSSFNRNNWSNYGNRQF